MSWWTHPELRWYRGDLEHVAQEVGVDVSLVAGVVLAESGGFTHAYRYEPMFWKRAHLATQPFYAGQNPRRWSARYGLMLVMATTAQECGHAGPPEDLFHPAIGLTWGCLYLRGCLDWAKQWHGNDRETIISALAAYHGGRNSAQKPPSPKHAPYALRVFEHIAKVA